MLDRNTMNCRPDGEWKCLRNAFFYTELSKGEVLLAYSQNQPWINSAFDENGKIRKPYLTRLTRHLG